MGDPAARRVDEVLDVPADIRDGHGQRLMGLAEVAAELVAGPARTPVAHDHELDQVVSSLSDSRTVCGKRSLQRPSGLSGRSSIASNLRDLYSHLLTMSWAQLWALIAAVFARREDARRAAARHPGNRAGIARSTRLVPPRYGWRHDCREASITRRRREGGEAVERSGRIASRSVAGAELWALAKLHSRGRPPTTT